MSTAGCGFQTSALCFSGESPVTGKTEFFNGTSWTELNDLSQSRRYAGGAGAAISALALGGLNPSSSELSAVEEWTADIANTTITSS